MKEKNKNPFIFLAMYRNLEILKKFSGHFSGYVYIFFNFQNFQDCKIKNKNKMHNHIERNITRLFITWTEGLHQESSVNEGPPLLVGDGYCHCHFAGRNLVRKFERLPS
jgi:hypothetical protein